VSLLAVMLKFCLALITDEAQNLTINANESITNGETIQNNEFLGQIATNFQDCLVMLAKTKIEKKNPQKAAGCKY
jgi:hypothetical protein